MRYRQIQVISGKGAQPEQFAEALRGIAVDGTGKIYAAGDHEIKVFDRQGKLLRRWDTALPAHCVALMGDNEVWVGEPGQIERFDSAGMRLGQWRDEERLATVTSICFWQDQVIVADARHRCLRRYDSAGTWISDIGADNRTRGFVIPNGHLDACIDKEGVICAISSGKFRIERYSLDGKLLGFFGHFGMRKPEDFTGCCNPTNLALTPAGNYAVTEKAGPRVKIIDGQGALITVVATDVFDPNCKNMDLAVDAEGTIYVVDTVRLNIHVFVREPEPADDGA